MKQRQRKRLHFWRWKVEARGIMSQAWAYDKRGRLVKHVMRYLTFDEWQAIGENGNA